MTTTREANSNLFDAVAAGDPAAREQLILQNMPLVQYKVDNFLRAFPKYNYLRDDLVSEGYVGLVEVVNKIARGELENTNPTGYLGLAIQESISIAIEDDALIRVPRRTQNYKKRTGEPLELPRKTNTLAEVSWCSDGFDFTADMVLRDELLACCEIEEEREILRLREMGHPDETIAAILGLARVTVYMLRREIYGRFLERNPEVKGEV